ncbi:hypothetical protein B0H15DRAFT_855854 [Mycena belliarum]|uniref:Uncharacterized protein n=1 Tax=Mycena belliarum TaxID=1033014 RepID=A0AAD6XM38_9AGAR|nr:hypothetical protein B0H15DRAFT_855854 [Mycena belliae]
MLLEIDDDDAAILFAELRRRSDLSQPRAAALERVKSSLVAEGQRRHLRWVVVDEDMEMGVPEPLLGGIASRGSNASPPSSIRQAPNPKSSAANTRSQTPPPLLSSPTSASCLGGPQHAPRSSPCTPVRPHSARPMRSLRQPLGRLSNTPQHEQEKENDPDPFTDRTIAIFPPPLLQGRFLLSSAPEPSTTLRSPALGAPIRLLSPLRFPTPTPSSASTSPSRRPSSPASTLVGSAAVSPEKAASTEDSNASVLGKRGREDSEVDAGGDQKTTRGSKRPRPRGVEDDADYRGRGEGNHKDDEDGDEQDGEASPHHARRLRGGRGQQPRRRRRSRTPCPRGGNRPRVDVPRPGPQARTIEEVQRELEEELNGGDGAGDVDEQQPGGANERWSTSAPPPNLSARTSKPIVWLSYVTTSPERQDKLIALLNGLSNAPNPTPTASAPSDEPAPTSESVSIKALANLCGALEDGSVLNDFRQLMSFMNLALYIQWRKTAGPGHKKVTYASLAREVANPRITGDRLSRWFTAGSRVVYVAAASSLYIIPMLAAAGMKTDFCFKYTCRQVQVLAFALCNPAPPDGTYSLMVSCGKLIRDVIAPQMALIKQLSSALEERTFRVIVPGTEPRTAPFSNVAELNGILRRFNVNFYALPAPDPVWDCLNREMLRPSLAHIFPPSHLDDSCIAEEIKIVSPLQVKNTKCPVTKQNTDSWTLAERAKASKAREMGDITELKAEIAKLHAGGVKTKDTYICIDTKICDGKVLHIRGQDNKLIALVATNILDTLPHLDTTLLAQLASVMEGEVYAEKSKGIDQSFVAWHCQIYNRYSQNGSDAPKDVHPNYVQKKGKRNANTSQRVPYASKEVEENPEEAAMLQEMIHLLTIIAEHHVKKFLPEDYEELKIFVTRLPLNERSLAYPFGGFVINISVSTKGHRDRFDKLFCVVIPFGYWTGGELCLFEPGFVFRLKSWDLLIFASCDVTHFNLDFDGVRLSLVLHSDKYGDKWVRSGNGWLPNGEEDSD